MSKKNSGNTKLKASIQNCNGDKTMATKTISRKVDNPQNPGSQIVRKAHVTFPQVGKFNNEGDLISGSVSVDDLLNTFGSLDRIAELANDAVVSKVRTIAFNELGKGDEVSKNIAKAMKALQALPGMDGLGEDTLKQMLLQSPQIQSALANVNIEPEITFSVDIERLFTDARKKTEETEEEEEVTTA